MIIINSNNKKCDICYNNTNIKKECCGIKICNLCDYKFHGLCCVCEKDTINKEFNCFTCTKNINILNSGWCIYCGKNHCETCLHINYKSLSICNNQICKSSWFSKLTPEFKFRKAG